MAPFCSQGWDRQALRKTVTWYLEKEKNFKPRYFQVWCEEKDVQELKGEGTFCMVVFDFFFLHLSPLPHGRGVAHSKTLLTVSHGQQKGKARAWLKHWFSATALWSYMCMHIYKNKWRFLIFLCSLKAYLCSADISSLTDSTSRPFLLEVDQFSPYLWSGDQILPLWFCLGSLGSIT